MSAPQSRLQRRLRAQEPILEVNAHESWDDRDISSITMTHGAGADAIGTLSSDATIVVRGEAGPSQDQALEIRLTDYGHQLLHDRLGLGTNTAGADRFQARWWGRIGRQTITDTRGGRHSQLVCGDWLAEVARAKPVYTAPNNNPRISTIIEAGIAAVLGDGSATAGTPPSPEFNPDVGVVEFPQGSVIPGVDAIVPLVGDGLQYWLSANVNEGGKVPWDDVLNVYTATAGNLLHSTRTGLVRGIPGYYLHELATDPATRIPLTRRQCVSPASWEQPVSSPAVLNYERLSGGIRTLRVGSGARPVRTSLIETSKISDPTGGDASLPARTSLAHAMEAHAWRLGGILYVLPEVEIDILRLINSPLEHDRRLVLALLKSEPFDTVALGYDWPDAVAGVHFITTVTETITHDSWTIRLGLAPTRHITGQESPQVIGDTWETSYHSTTAWDDIPETTTWDTTPEEYS